VVDDTPVNLTVFVSLLKRTGLQIDTAESGDDCISLFTKRHYDVIFLDHMMPEKDGIETLKEMKAIADTPNAATPVICLTANAISGMREMYKNAGFDDYLTKPIDAEKLEMMLLSYLPKEKVNAPTDNDVADTATGADTAANEGGDSAGEEGELPAFLTGIKELDLKAGIDYCGDGESLLEALQMYLESAEKKSKEIENNWASRDIQNVTIKVHGLKSSSRAIGAVELGELAERLEKAGKDGDTDTLEKELGELLERYRQLASDLEPLRDLE
jgi:CheY-like chemotaxis protein